jgi:hypothetical protein
MDNLFSVLMLIGVLDLIANLSANDYFGENLCWFLPHHGLAEFMFVCCSTGTQCYLVQVLYGHRSDCSNAANLNSTQEISSYPT